MLNTISWGQYAGGVLLLLVLYYAYVGATYYRDELLALLKGKGKAGGPAETAASTLATVARQGPLITKSAFPLPAPPPEIAGPALPGVAPETEAGSPVTAASATGEKISEAKADAVVEAASSPPAAGELTLPELPPLYLTSVALSKNSNYENTSDNEFINDYTINLANSSATDLLAVTESGVSATLEEVEPVFTVGIAQLGDFLARAAESQLTPAEVVEQVPALDNTDLLLAFFQTSSQRAQRLTSQRFAEVAEPGLD
jgi:hypothetical protein